MRPPADLNSKVSRLHAGRSGFALIFVLSCVVLLTAVVVAFLSWSTLNRQVSSSNTGLATAAVLGQGGINTIISDLQQEIVAGSTPAPITTGTVTTTLYNPTVVAAGGPVSSAVPATVFPTTSPTRAISTTAGETDGLANLIKVSTNGVPFYPATSPYTPASPYPNGRASKALSTTPSLNGRSVTLARWNQHLLVDRKSETSTDTTPVAAFPTPTWVLVARDGSDTSTLTAPPNPSTASNAVVGRYAYAVYDEGGLLDVNVAGSPITASATSPWTGYKNALAYADLTQLPGISGLTPAQQTSVINAIVGWRNALSSHASGYFPSYIPYASTPAPGTAGTTPNPFDSSILYNVNGFLGVRNDPYNPQTALANNTTDRSFGSRQSLITLLTQGVAQGDTTTLIPALQQSLQYLGTFSRDLNQPSVWPDKGRPFVVGGIGNISATTITNYPGGNDQATKDDSVNPSFLSVRVQTAFQRYDNGQNLPANLAVVGEPLVKKRFPLDRLAWLTYEGPSATVYANNNSDPIILALLQQGISLDMIKQGNAANIATCFGLSWNPTTGNAPVGNFPSGDTSQNCWTYLRNAPGPINTLAQVALLSPAREPNFVELLKAGINVGSLGKGAATTDAYTGAYHHFMDTTVDFQVMQIFANIIDQFDSDSIPTWIQFNNGVTDPTGSTPTTRNFYGVENLPYLQEIFTNAIQVIAPDPPPDKGYNNLYGLSSSPIAAFPKCVVPPTLPAITTINKTGEGVLLATPCLWNPHDAATSVGTVPPTSASMKFRVTAETLNPQRVAVPNKSSFNVYMDPLLDAKITSLAGVTPTVQQGINPPDYVLKSDRNLTSDGLGNPDGLSKLAGSSGITWTSDYAQIQFSLANTAPSVFREPTVLHSIPNPSLPTLAMTGVAQEANLYSYAKNGVFTDIFGGSTSIGFYAGAFPLRQVYRTDLEYQISASTQPVAPASMYGSYYDVIYSASGAFAQDVVVTYRTEFSLNGSAWQTYNLQYVDYSVYIAGFYNGLGMPNTFTGVTGDPTGTNDWKSMSVAWDPRTSRFGFTYAYPQGLNLAYPGYVNAANNIINNPRPSDQDDIMIFNKNVPSVTSGTGWVLSQIGTAPNIAYYAEPGRLTENNPLVAVPFATNTPYLDNGPEYYRDPDGVVRRAMGAYYYPADTGRKLTSGVASSAPASNRWPFGTTSNAYSPAPLYPGLPMISTLGASAQAAGSRPIVLNRPFHSVAELGYVFRDDPWKNLDFFTPQSGDASLLDVFCVHDDTRPDALLAGKVNVNTRQVPVLQAILAGAYKDELNYPTTFSSPTTTASSSVATQVTATEAQSVAIALVNRTNSAAVNKGPLRNISELVGKCIIGYSDLYTPYYTTVAAAGGSATTVGYAGFVDDLSAALTAGSVGETMTTAPNIVQRMRETTTRALSQVGTARTWNLLLDVVAQTGRYTPNSTTLDQFFVGGEQHYWVHVAIDRYTGQVIDENIETVKD